ncbi:MAG: hypothetical protein DIU79_16385 [Actinobacteria bacterium]|nr:MAG: hypothetical protein DIU79_16385 [Actinomycetota bacterium]
MSSKGRVYGGASVGPFSVSAPLTGSRRGRGRGRGGKEATSSVAGVLAIVACCCCVSPIVSSRSDEPERTPRSSAPSATRSLAPSPTAPSPTSSVSPSPAPATAKPSPTRTTTEAKPKPSAPRLDPRFGTCKEVKAHGYGPYIKGVDPEYEWYRDRDGDGVVCE